MLQFDNNRQFRILILADVQEYRILNEESKRLIQQAILLANPHFIVLLGDMLFGPLIPTKRRTERIIDSILAVIEMHRIPFAIVSGNHDKDAITSFQKQISMYKKSSLCLTPAISDRKCPDAYYLDVTGNHGEACARLLFLDSGATKLSLSGLQYRPASDGQLRFTRSLLSNDACPPLFVFQHVPVPEIYKLIDVVSAETDYVVKGNGPYKGRYLIMKEQCHGIMGEAPCPPWENAGQFDDWAKSGKVRAAVFGHDHKNSFDGVIDGIALLQTSCAGLHCYGKDELRGTRLLQISADGSFEHRVLYYRNMK